MKLFALTMTLFASVQALTTTQETSLRGILWNWLSEGDKDVEGAQFGDTVAAIVRLVFHDAGTFNRADGSGGSHGCITVLCEKKDECEFTAPDNNGLQTVVLGLLALYEAEQLSTVLSKADWIHLAGVVAVEMSSGKAVDMPFKWGRVDCEAGGFPVRLKNSLPDANWERDDVLRFFGNRLGMTTEETIVLLGAHTLGRAEIANAGFDGAWTESPGTLDNAYFKDLMRTDVSWIRETVVGSGNRQWRSHGRSSNKNTIMLTADVGLFWKVCATNPRSCNNCQITHVTGSCVKNQNEFNIAEGFASNNNRFLSVFKSSFIKLQELGQKTLKPACKEEGGTPAELFCRKNEPKPPTTSTSTSATTTTAPTVTAKPNVIAPPRPSEFLVEDDTPTSTTPPTTTPAKTAAAPADPTAATPATTGGAPTASVPSVLQQWKDKVLNPSAETTSDDPTNTTTMPTEDATTEQPTKQYQKRQYDGQEYQTDYQQQQYQSQPSYQQQQYQQQPVTNYQQQQYQQQYYSQQQQQYRPQNYGGQQQVYQQQSYQRGAYQQQPNYQGR
eukprot:gb/GEZN01003731.1/.p1 GENE.gb/GEZN01003731.1/~~gb/GEZN01003731.1/.p1  ORF type:complete len:556 (-),score=100.44 gb/GEZN01003731.1/:338-2005(-)